MSYDLTYLSLGAGVQSSALFVMSLEGYKGIPRVDVAIFSDTGCEPQWVYDQVKILDKWGWEKHGMGVERVSAGDLGNDILDAHSGKRSRFAAIPVWTLGKDGKPVPLRRQCTREYKITPIERRVRGILGIGKGKRAKGKVKVRCLLGISLDEAHRMRDSRTGWVENEYPLVDLGIRRQDCLKYMEEQGFSLPGKSACVICPYHSNLYWKDLKEKYPEEFEKAVCFDNKVRDMSHSGIRNPVYLHKSLRPLREVDFEALCHLPLFGSDSFGNECEGVCGT